MVRSQLGECKFCARVTLNAYLANGPNVVAVLDKKKVGSGVVGVYFRLTCAFLFSLFALLL